MKIVYLIKDENKELLHQKSKKLFSEINAMYSILIM